ncbi:MAG: flagellar biosynthesis anti-sigma factor FlgM [Limnohabitans sp.]|nr:flagellar biosynthesis anti-sigma factor FlgM [Limnohabitans sp.]
MSDPIPNNAARISSSNSASRSTLDKLNNKAVTTKSDSASETKAHARSQGSDSVSLSNVKDRIDAQPAFDRAKVESIKAALQQGNYPVSPRRIAENFVSLEKMILG